MKVSVVSMIDALEELLEDASTLLTSLGPDPVPGSVAAMERLEWREGDEPETAHSLGLFLLETAGDHAFALARALRPPEYLAIAPWTCARAVLESAAYGTWVMDPSATLRERVGRSFACVYVSHEQFRRAAVAANDADGVHTITGMIDSLEGRAVQSGYPRLSDRRGRRLGVGVRYPRATDCIREQLDMEYEYRIFSGVAHGLPSSVMQVCFRPVDGAQPAVQKHLQPEYAAFLLRQSTRAVVGVMNARLTLYGHNVEDFAPAVARAYSRMLPQPPS